MEGVATDKKHLQIDWVPDEKDDNRTKHDGDDGVFGI